ncbi:MAG: HAMP domain-containing sensor histidine kinase [Pseudomonadota bacterium]|nr:HAMP domain-containing sensor histidine kinase [Pseudomonadota bacterium]
MAEFDRRVGRSSSSRTYYDTFDQQLFCRAKYADISGFSPFRSGDLTRFVNEDERGREVFNYFHKLLELLAEKKRERKIILDEMDGAVNMAAEIIRLQQLYAGGPDEHRELVDINTVLQDALRMQAGALTKRGIEVKIKLTSGLPRLMIDRNRFLQVLVNLLKNAYEAIEALSLGGAPARWEKVITISSQVKDNHVYMEIADTGIGINFPEKEKLFEFGRSHKGSSGFGLYYCRQFIEKNQGTIAIESHGSGQGALVRIVLPIGKNDD